MTTSPIGPADLRIGDAERQQTADLLANAHALGQLEVDEFHERVERAHAAKYQRDLDTLTDDLPAAQTAKTRGWLPAQAGTNVRAAGALLASVPRKVWIVLAAAAMTLMVAGMVFDGDHGEWHERGPGHHGGAEHAYDGGGFFAGAMSVIGTLLLIAAAFFVVRRVRARKAASRNAG